MADRATSFQWSATGASRDLSARAAVVADRIADLLEAACSPESGAPATVSFLREWAAAAIARRPAIPEFSPIAWLCDAFALSAIECDLILLAGLCEEHEGLASTFRAIHPRGDPRPTVGLAAHVVEVDDADARDFVRVLLTSGPLIRHGLLRVVGDGPLFERSLQLADRLWEVLHGDDAWPDRVPRVDLRQPPPGLAGWLGLHAVQRAVAALRSGDQRTLILSDPDDVVGLSRCAGLADAAGRTLAGGVVTPDDRRGIALVVAHAIARHAIPVLVVRTTFEEVAGPPVQLDLDDSPGPVLVCAAPGGFLPAGARAVVTVPSGPIRPEAHRRAWRGALPGFDDMVGALAARHPLDPGVIADVAADIRSQQALHGGLSGLRDISDVIRGRVGVVLPAGVQLTAPSVPWESLVLPEEPEALLRDAVARLEHAATVLDDWGFLEGARANRGIRLMFTGQPGTGKSLASEVVATAAATDLLVVDVSQVMSKWVGETEKNLSRIFDAAERTQAVLQLDEADALFTQRTQVSDAQDRYVNLHTAYLLQRLDRFEGLAVLTTNLRQNIDPAFIRRMDFIVEFPLPDESHRERLWRLHLPSTAAVADDLDIPMLARMYPVPGGWIRNTTLAAAFLAATEDSAIHQRHLLKAMRREYAKAVRPFPGEPPVRSGDAPTHAGAGAGVHGGTPAREEAP